VPKTPYELWTGRELSLNYLRVWGCLAEAKVFNPNIGKLDSKIVNCYFIGYPEKSNDYRFYCPDKHTKFVEMRHAVFLKEELIRASMVAREINLEEKRVHVPTPLVQEPFFMLPIVSSPVMTMNEHEEPVLQDPIKPSVAHEEE
jgi:hypothetical protein